MYWACMYAIRTRPRGVARAGVGLGVFGRDKVKVTAKTCEFRIVPHHVQSTKVLLDTKPGYFWGASNPLWCLPSRNIPKTSQNRETLMYCPTKTHTKKNGGEKKRSDPVDLHTRLSLPQNLKKLQAGVADKCLNIDVDVDPFTRQVASIPDDSLSSLSTTGSSA